MMKKLDLDLQLRTILGFDLVTSSALVAEIATYADLPPKIIGLVLFRNCASENWFRWIHIETIH